MNAAENAADFGLNPCFNGRYSQSTKEFLDAHRGQS